MYIYICIHITYIYIIIYRCILNHNHNEIIQYQNQINHQSESSEVSNESLSLRCPTHADAPQPWAPWSHMAPGIDRDLGGRNGGVWKNHGKIMGKYENIPQKLMILMGKSSINWVGLSSHVWWPEGISRLWNLLGIRTECFSVYFFWGEPERSIPGKVAIAQKWHTNESKKLLAKGCRAI